MPAEQRVGRDDRGDLAQGVTAQAVRPRSQSPPIVIGEAQAPPTQLPAQEAVLLKQVGDRLPFAALQPAGQGQQQDLEGRGIDHERELISQPAEFARDSSSIELWDTTWSTQSCLSSSASKTRTMCSITRSSHTRRSGDVHAPVAFTVGTILLADTGQWQRQAGKFDDAHARAPTSVIVAITTASVRCSVNCNGASTWAVFSSNRRR
jgi:hypothetical protein